jgi:hypothetical protein
MAEIAIAIVILIGLVSWFANLFRDPPEPRDIFARARTLQNDFINLGPMTGKTANEIITIVGPPSSRSFMANNYMLLQWQETGYHIACLFDVNERFVKITSEYAHGAR